MNDPESDSVLANRTNWPFYVATFDHPPTEDEIQADFERFLMASENTGNSVTYYPKPQQVPDWGQKSVRIAAKTGTGSNAGTNGEDLIRFEGTWERDDGIILVDDFVLDDPNKDDLERDTTSVFYYLIPPLGSNPNTLPYSSDRFLRGRIKTFSADGWYCSAIDLAESNYRWYTRNQHLPFDQRMDYPDNNISPPKSPTDLNWLAYK